ncbi:hypothetical protein AVEN_232986-1, partial [Araneus ventricosus]
APTLSRRRRVEIKCPSRPLRGEGEGEQEFSPQMIVASKPDEKGPLTRQRALKYPIVPTSSPRPKLGLHWSRSKEDGGFKPNSLL